MQHPMHLLPVGIVAAALLLPSPLAAQGKTTSVAAFSGYDTGPTGNAYYLGAIVALNGDFGRDGVLLRGLGVYGTYHYLDGVGEILGRYWLFDEMIGYQFIRPGWIRIAGYVGAEQQDHRLSRPDPTNRVVGNEMGLKVVGDVTLGHNQPLFATVITSYSTAFDTYWHRLRVGYKIDRFTFGPELIYSGNIGNDERRTGAFAQVRIDKTPIDIGISAGRHINDKNGTFGNENGAYAQFNLGLTF
jgi:cellulose biosynthesis protein BcsS